VAAEEENNKKNEGKGFAGLSSLVSDVDTTPPPLRLRRNRPARRNPPNAQTRKLLDRSSRLSVRRIKSLRNRLLARLGANGYWA